MRRTSAPLSAWRPADSANRTLNTCGSARIAGSLAGVGRTASGRAGAAWNDAIGNSSTNMLVSLKKRPAVIGENT
jgi:hypothetical protein